MHNYQSNQSAFMTRCRTDLRDQCGIFGGESGRPSREMPLEPGVKLINLVKQCYGNSLRNSNAFKSKCEILPFLQFVEIFSTCSNRYALKNCD